MYFIKVLKPLMRFQNRKRRYYEEGEDVFIDLPFLINSEKILTEKEFKEAIHNYDYASYFVKFLKRRATTCFDLYSTSQWFKDRYLKDKTDSVLQDGTLFVIVKNIPSNLSEDDLIDQFSKLENISGVYLSRINISDFKSKNIFLLITDAEKIQSTIENLSLKHEVEKIDISEINIKENYNIPQKTLHCIFNNLCSISNLEPEKICENFFKKYSKYNSITTESLTALLRDTFNFCPVCCKQYDSKVEMLVNCSNHDEKKFCARSLTIFSYSCDYQSLKSSIQSKDETQKMILNTPENTYKCKKCSKIFSSLGYICTHINSKHWSDLMDYEKASILKCLFVGRLDFFMLDLLCGTQDGIPPSYARPQSSNSSNQVVYDAPSIFSGNITL